MKDVTDNTKVKRQKNKRPGKGKEKKGLIIGKNGINMRVYR